MTTSIPKKFQRRPVKPDDWEGNLNAQPAWRLWAAEMKISGKSKEVKAAWKEVDAETKARFGKKSKAKQAQLEREWAVHMEAQAKHRKLLKSYNAFHKALTEKDSSHVPPHIAKRKRLREKQEAVKIAKKLKTAEKRAKKTRKAAAAKDKRKAVAEKKKAKTARDAKAKKAKAVNAKGLSNEDKSSAGENSSTSVDDGGASGANKMEVDSEE